MPRWSGGTFTLDNGVITDANVATSAAIDNDKLQHLFKAGTDFTKKVGDTPVTAEYPVFVASAAGTIRHFSCGCYDTGTSASVTFDLKKNGVSVLSSAVTVTNATADRAITDGTLSVTTYAADDWFSIALTVSSSTGMTGPFAWAEFEEAAG